MKRYVRDVIAHRQSAFARPRAALRLLGLLLAILSLTSNAAWAATLKVGDILVADGNADGGRGAIILVDPISGAQSIISAGQFFVDPVSLAIENDGNIVVVDRAIRTVLRVNSNTGVQTVLSAGGFIDPFGLVLDPAGNIYVADTGWDQVTGVNIAGRIIRVDPITGIQTIVSSGGFLADPWTLAVENTGKLVVADSSSVLAPFTGQGGVIRVDPVTGAQSAVSVYTAGPAGTPGCPFGIAVEASGSILTTTFSYPDPPEPLVYGCVPPAIHRVNPVTGAQTIVSAYPTWGWRLPFGIDVDLDGTLIVSDEAINAVFRVNPVDGTPTVISIFGLFVDPVDVAVVKTPPTGGGGNSAPVILSVNASPASVNEAGSTTVNGTFADPDVSDGHSVNILWGDGSNSTIDLPAGVLTFSASHTYPDDTPSGTTSDSYSISVTVTDSMLSDTDSTTISVNNVPPVITGTSGPSGTQALGSAVSVGANFTDAGVLDTHTCSVNWGDGATTSGMVTESNGSGSCAASHTYTTAGTYSVGITVTDDDTGSTSSTRNVTINAATAITTLSATGPISENGSTTLSGTFSDPDAADTHTVTITWADGTSNTILNLAAGVHSFSASHQYLDDNPTNTASDNYPISVVLTDNNGSSNSGGTSVTVMNAAPLISSVTGPTAPVTLGSSATITANFTDVGSKDTHTCTFAWGDGTANTVVTAAGTGNGNCSASHTYAAAGGYSVTVTVKDDDTGTVNAVFQPVTVQAPVVLTKIVFMSTRDGNAEIYSMNSDGTGTTRLTNNSAIDAFPVWSPDRTKVLFTSTRAGSSADIYVMNANGSGVVRLTTTAKVNGIATWSPNGAKIAFTSNRDGNYEVYVMNANGSGQTRITNNSAVDTTPVFSPDGTKIAFTSNRAGNYEVYVMNANGSSVINLSNNSGMDVDPSWSPDGTKIAFTSSRNNNFEIYSMNANGSSQTRLTNNTAIDAEPSWSPDGTKILFTTNRISFANSEIYVMKSDGTNVVRLTNNSALDTSAHW